MMNNLREMEDQLPAQAARGPIGAKSKKRQGKGSSKRANERFRERIGTQELEEFRQGILDSMMFSRDEGQLLRSVNSVQLTQQERAIPLTVATRGVGFITAIVYRRTCTTWDLGAISMIATIYQIYRVHLWLVHLKVYLAQQCQVEPVTTPGALERITVRDDIRELLYTVTRVPSTLAMMLDNVGKIKINDRIYHMGYAANCPENFASLVITPTTIRQILVSLTQAANHEMRADFIAHNSIPGLNVEAGFAVNIDSVWPADAENLLAGDVHAYKSWVTRVESRLPRHSFSDITWSGQATSGGLWSTERLSLCLTSQFTPGRARTVRRRDAAGELVEEREQVEAIYNGFTLTDERTTFWSRENTPHVAIVAGIAGLVGEVCHLSTRHEIHSARSVVHSPIALMYALTDAPR